MLLYQSINREQSLSTSKASQSDSAPKPLLAWLLSEKGKGLGRTPLPGAAHHLHNTASQGQEKNDQQESVTGVLGTSHMHGFCSTAVGTAHLGRACSLQPLLQTEQERVKDPG